jgi:tRNA(adenine34) deaminase
VASSKTTASALDDAAYMREALRLAKRAYALGEVPVGCVLVDSKGDVVAEGYNQTERDFDATAHAEVIALRAKQRRSQSPRIPDITMYVTLEPCVMCAGAIVWSRIQRVIFGAWDAKAGAIASCYQIGSDKKLNHAFEAKGGVLDGECAALLKEFFQARRR